MTSTADYRRARDAGRAGRPLSARDAANPDLKAVYDDARGPRHAGEPRTEGRTPAPARAPSHARHRSAFAQGLGQKRRGAARTAGRIVAGPAVSASVQIWRFLFLVVAVSFLVFLLRRASVVTGAIGILTRGVNWVLSPTPL